MKTSVGSLKYSAPEVLLADPYDGPSADVWSLGLVNMFCCKRLMGCVGVILYMLVTGTLPFHEHDENATLIKIMEVTYEVGCTYSFPPLTHTQRSRTRCQMT